MTSPLAPVDALEAMKMAVKALNYFYEYGYDREWCPTLISVLTSAIEQMEKADMVLVPRAPGGKGHGAIRKVLQYHNLTVHGDGVVEADLWAAMIAAWGKEQKK